MLGVTAAAVALRCRGCVCRYSVLSVDLGVAAAAVVLCCCPWRGCCCRLLLNGRAVSLEPNRTALIPVALAPGSGPSTS